MKHAQHRSLERHGQKLSVLDLTNLRFLIERKVGISSWFCKHGTNDTSEKWIVEYKEEMWYVVYDPMSRKVVTILNDPHPEVVKRTVRRTKNESR